MQKPSWFVRLLLTSWIAKLLGWSGASLATVGVHLTYEQNAPGAIADILIGLVLMATHALLSHLTLAHAADGASKTPLTVSPGTKALLFFALLSPFLLTGCITTVPAPFIDANPPLSDSDAKIVKACAGIEASCPAIRTTSSVGTSVGMYYGLKTPAQQIQIGSIINISSKNLISVLSGKLPTPSDITTELTSLKANASDFQVAANVESFSSVETSAYSSLYGQFQTWADNAKDPTVKAYVIKVAVEVVTAIAQGAQDATTQYATTVTTTSMIQDSGPYDRGPREYVLHPVACDDAGLVVYSF